MSKDMTQLLDELEQVLIDSAYSLFIQADIKKEIPDFSKENARNIVGKVGMRIAFGPDLYDKALKDKEQLQ